MPKDRKKTAAGKVAISLVAGLLVMTAHLVLAAPSGSSCSLNRADPQEKIGRSSYETGLQAYKSGDFSAALIYFKLAAGKDYIEAFIQLGDMYRQGHGVRRSLDKALGFYKRAADGGLAQARTLLDVYGTEGEEVSTLYTPDTRAAATEAADAETPASEADLSLGRAGYAAGLEALEAGDYEAALTYFKLAANKGYAEALVDLGNMYGRGSGVRQNPNKARELYRMAAAKGVRRAIELVGGEGATARRGAERSGASDESIDFDALIGEQGAETGRAVDYEGSIAGYEIAARDGSAKAMTTLGHFYRLGKGVQRNYAKALEYYSKASDRSHPAARYYIGLMHELGQGVIQDIYEAINWYKKAARLESTDALIALGRIYLMGDGGVEQDPGAAVKYYKDAARLGDVRAQFNLGMMYEHGEGVEIDLEEAAYWYVKAAEGGDAKSQYLAGMAYHAGVGVPKDIPKAIEWFKKAAEGNINRACAAVATIYHVGDGVRQDLAEAAKWYRRGAEMGNPSSMCLLGELYYTGKGVELDYKEAARLFKEAAEWGLPQAMFDLGVIYLNGHGVPKDEKEAVSWFRKAARLGHSKAEQALANLGR